MTKNQPKGGLKNQAAFQSIYMASMVVLKTPEPITVRPKARRRLTNSKLRALAATHRPPQSWYDNDADESC